MTVSKNSPKADHRQTPQENHPLVPGTMCEVVYRIAASDSPRALRLENEDDFPDVFATARMIGLMELAAARLMRPLLAAGELSVGVVVDVKHLAATPLFVDIRARATYLGPEGKLYRFKVELLDQGGLAGEGIHTRAIVRSQRLTEGALRRVNVTEEQY